MNTTLLVIALFTLAFAHKLNLQVRALTTRLDDLEDAVGQVSSEDVS